MVFTSIFSLTSVAFVRLILAVLLFVAAFLKFPSLRTFADVVDSFNILPSSLARFLAYPYPFIELAVSILLFMEYQLVFVAAFTLLMMLVSSSFILIALLKQRKLENCGCFGNTFKVPVSWLKFAENFVWVLAAVYVLIGAIILGI